MTRFGWAVALGALVIIIGVGAVFAWRYRATPVATGMPQATTTPVVDPAALSIYTSGEYGFALFYPSDATVTDAYSSTTLSGIGWSATGVGTGTPIVRIQEGDEEVRVGKSTDAKEVAACTTAMPAEESDGPFMEGSTTWNRFSFQKIGTDNEELVTSYRTLHDRACYALELFQPLSGTASTTGYTLSDTITSFSFAD